MRFYICGYTACCAPNAICSCVHSMLCTQCNMFLRTHHAVHPMQSVLAYTACCAPNAICSCVHSMLCTQCNLFLRTQHAVNTNGPVSLNGVSMVFCVVPTVIIHYPRHHWGTPGAPLGLQHIHHLYALDHPRTSLGHNISTIDAP
jgi:predicted Rdx family selenoprotein